MSGNVAEYVFDAYYGLIEGIREDGTNMGVEIALPAFSRGVLLELCESAVEHFKQGKALLRLEGPVVVVGDIHGDLRDLMRILHAQGSWYDTKFLFLGDYIDRGEFQIEVITFLLAFAIQYPSQVFLLRGNHECESINEMYGFHDQVTSRYSERLWREFNRVFTYLPLAAVISDRIFCVHGGLSPDLVTLKDVESLSPPIRDTYQQMIFDMLWSDPDDYVLGFFGCQYGRSIVYGPSAVEGFLARNNLTTILRAHESINSGCQALMKGKVITVFSSSGYGSADSLAGYVRVQSDLEITMMTLPPFPRVPRQAMTFTPMTGKPITESRPVILRPSLGRGGDRLREFSSPTARKKDVVMTWIPEQSGGDSAQQLQGREGEGDSKSPGRPENGLVHSSTLPRLSRLPSLPSLPNH